MTAPGGDGGGLVLWGAVCTGDLWIPSCEAPLVVQHKLADVCRRKSRSFFSLCIGQCVAATKQLSLAAALWLVSV